MAFGDKNQQQHMMDGVRRAAASAKTPQHLRPHLEARLGGGTMRRPGIQPAPRKTLTGPTGRVPIKAVVPGPTARYTTRPPRVIVGSTARPPVKTVVGESNAPPVKKRVETSWARNTRPPLKETPANLGQGSNGPRPRGVLDRAPLGSTSPSISGRSLGNGDGNPGRSVGSMPAPATGPPNPVLDWQVDRGLSSIQSGGMGQTNKPKEPTSASSFARGRPPISMSAPTFRPQRGRGRRPRNAFFGE